MWRAGSPRPGTSEGRSAVPIGIERANGGSGRRVGRKAKQQDRRGTPLRPSFRMARRADISSKPTHRARRSGGPIIAGAGKDGNRQQPGDSTPMPPVMKIRHSVGAHQPDEAEARISAENPRQRVDGKARAFASLEVADADRRSARQRLGRGEPRLQRRHVLRRRLERVAGRDQPPHLVEAQRLGRVDADLPVPAMGGVEGAAEEAGKRHREAVAWRARQHERPRRWRSCGMLLMLGERWRKGYPT